jgi:hypothetical protein
LPAPALPAHTCACAAPLRLRQSVSRACACASRQSISRCQLIELFQLNPTQICISANP